MGSKAREGAKAMSLAFVLLDFQHTEWVIAHVCLTKENCTYMSNKGVTAHVCLAKGNCTYTSNKGVIAHVCLLKG